MNLLFLYSLQKGKIVIHESFLSNAFRGDYFPGEVCDSKIGLGLLLKANCSLLNTFVTFECFSNKLTFLIDECVCSEKLLLLH